MLGIKNLRKWPGRIGGALCQAGRTVPGRSICQDSAYYYQYAAKCPRQNRFASPGHGQTNAGFSFRARAGSLRSWLEYWCVTPFRDAQDKRLVSPFFIEVFVKFQAQLPGVYPNGTVLQVAIIGRFVEQHVADVLLRQFVRMPLNG